MAEANLTISDEERKTLVMRHQEILKQQRTERNPFSDSGSLTSRVMDWIKGSSAPKTVEDFTLLFSQLEIHAKNTDKPPIILWRDIQNIDEIRNAPTDQWSQHLKDLLFIHFEPRKQRTSFLPVIFESSDFLWSRSQMNFSLESFNPYLLKPLSQHVAQSWLVDGILDGFKEPIFTMDEFKIVWEYSGGHQGTIYILHTMLREGRTMNDALEELQKQYFARLINVINERSSDKDDLENRKKSLLDLCYADYSLSVENLMVVPALLHLVRSNILFTDGDTVSPQNRPTQLSIERYIRKHVDNEKKKQTL